MTNPEETPKDRTLRLAEIVAESNGKPLLLSLHQLDQHTSELASKMGKYDLLNFVKASFRGKMGAIIQDIMKERDDTKQIELLENMKNDEATDLSIKSEIRQQKGTLHSRVKRLFNEATEDNGRLLLKELNKLGGHAAVLAENLHELKFISEYEKAVPSFGAATPIAIKIARKEGLMYTPSDALEEKDIYKKE